MTSLRDALNGISGRVIWPHSADYDQARRVFRGEVDKRPAVIVQVSGAEDVRAVIRAARETGLALAVRSGGHSAAGLSTTDTGIVLDVRGLKTLDIDPSARTAWAAGGLTAAEVTTAAWEHQLVVGFGDTGSVGISGITLGGGIGYVIRQWGLTIDNLLAAEIVTANGDLLTVDETHEPDLFWAIRGGGGNFGVATRFLYRLRPVAAFVGGMLILPATVDTITGWIDASESAPETVSTIANVMNCPPMPMVPPEVVGQPVIFGIVAHLGDAAAGENAIAPFRALAKPHADLMSNQPYPQIYGPEDDTYKPKAIDRTMFMNHVGTKEAQTMLDAIAASDAPLRAVQLRVLGGAMARVPVDATAFAHRQARILAVVVNFFEGSDDLTRREKWTNDLSAALDQGVPGAYVNFLRDEGPARLHAAYPGATWDRLAQVKARYDPDNLFHLNANIPPAS